MTPTGIPLPGCRHDVLGHALKAVGILRALAECADEDACDPSAEGWWDPDTATFRIFSQRYTDADSLTRFFVNKYRPTPIIAAWSKLGGLTDKIEVVIKGPKESLQSFRESNERRLRELGLTAKKEIKEGKPLKWNPDSSALSEIRELALGSSLVVWVRVKVEAPIGELKQFVQDQGEQLQNIGLSKQDLKPKKPGILELLIPSDNLPGLQHLLKSVRLPPASTRKESGKKDGTLPIVQRLLRSDPNFRNSLELAYDFGKELLEEKSEEEVAAKRYRDHLPHSVAEAFDALCILHTGRDNKDNPLFGRRGRPGDKVNTHIFLSYWEFFVLFKDSPDSITRASLFNDRAGLSGGKGTPYFPDAIKSYNQGTAWVTEDYPFCPLDYLLAVEGALAMRGATSKTLTARSRSHAAFPFVFEATETMTDEKGKALKLASSFWFPIWTQPTAYIELKSFIQDAQARLPSKDCRFSSDFGRAIRSQGVDAGFFAFQEFRFKLKGSNVPWPVTGRFVHCCGHAVAGVLNELLAPVDSCGFLDQFDFSKMTKVDLHPLRAPVLESIEEAAAEPDAIKLLKVLTSLSDLNSKLAKSKALREKIRHGRVVFVPQLRSEDWSDALSELDTDREFLVARAIASIRGRERQPDGSDSRVEPMLGSLMPLSRVQRTWVLPAPPSPQAVWSGIDLPRDLSAILARRVIDSEPDVRPALVGVCTARLVTVLAFLRGELDDSRIARLIEGLSLIDWYQPSITPPTDGPLDSDTEFAPIPVAYAAVRALIEVSCDARPSTVAQVAAPTPRASVKRPVSLVSRLTPGMVAAGVSEALHRLAIVGVPNCYSEDSRNQKARLAGRDVISLNPMQLTCDSTLSRRLAAAALIPLDRRDRWRLFRAVSLPQTT